MAKWKRARNPDEFLTTDIFVLGEKPMYVSGGVSTVTLRYDVVNDTVEVIRRKGDKVMFLTLEG